MPVVWQFRHQISYRDYILRNINFDNLKVQLQMLPDLLHTANEQCHLGIKKVTSISTICEILNSGHHGKVMLSEVHRLLRIYLTVPMTTATAERTFSTLRHLKNYLRSTMSLITWLYFIHIRIVLTIWTSVQCRVILLV